MTPQNIIGGFKSTGVYPLNRHAIVLPGENGLRKSGTPTVAMAKRKGISYMPFFSSTHDISEQDDCEVFAEEELQLFQRRYEEGFDICDDERYNHWLRVHHPEMLHDECVTCLFPSSPLTESTPAPMESTSVNETLDSPSPPEIPSQTVQQSLLGEFLPVPEVPVKKTGRKASGVCS